MMESTPAGTHPPPGRGLRIAVVGKGGSGKTMLVATMTRILASAGDFRVLAIDADCAVSLPYALGMEVGPTVSGLRSHLIEDPQARREAEGRHVSRLVGDILQRGPGFDLLVMGRPEGPGCYCAINDLLKYGIDSLSRQYDVTLIDCEAGPEQVNRRVVSGVEVLMVVTDASLRGVRVAGGIWDVVRRGGQEQPSRVGLVINRLRSRGDDTLIAEAAARAGLEILGRIPEDENVARCDAAGQPIAGIPASSPSVSAVGAILAAVLARTPGTSTRGIKREGATMKTGGDQMPENDVYQQLFREYAAFKVDMTQETMMEVLRLQFTPEEAGLAVKVGFRPKKLDAIQRKTRVDRSTLKQMLTIMGRKGTIYATPGADDPEYRLIGLGGPGLIETGGWGTEESARPVPLLKALSRWQIDLAEKWFPSLGIRVTRVWTTPAALPEDAKPEENLAEIMKKAGSWGVSTCSCRLPHRTSDPGHHCSGELETCLFMGEMARWGAENGMCRLITYEEAMEIVRRSNANGLVHTHDPSEFLCNCCRDCCIFFVSLRLTGTLPLEPSEFVAVVDGDTCSGCSDCLDRCPVKAISIDEVASIDAGKCLGCGVCYPACPSGSVSLVRRTAVEEGASATMRVM